MTNGINEGPFPTAQAGSERLVRAGTEGLDSKAVAAKVQSMFLEIMLKAMENSVGAEDGLFGNSVGADIYRGMLREHLATAMAERMKSPLERILNENISRSAVAGEVREEPLAPEKAVLPADGMPVEGVISSSQGWRRDPFSGETRYHSGIDIAAPAGTPIRAVAGGRVIESGVKGGYGNTVVIQAEDGRRMLYAHNRQNLVQAGDWVSTGDPIAEVGSTGRATGPHVHFEVKF
jgi:murein DD-endopeptidase MepM/ murein hydrolase activator NlpD